MNATTSPRHSDAISRRWFVGLLLGLPLVLYLSSAALQSRETGYASLASVPCFEPAMVADGTTLSRIAAVGMALGAILILFVVPLLLAALEFYRHPRYRATAPVWSLATNSLVLMLLCLLLRPTVGINRISVLVVWFLWLFALALLVARTEQVGSELRTWWRHHRFGLTCSILTVTIGIILFRNEQFLQCFNGDGVESFELARSLNDHVLPTWEIEPIDRFGAVIVNPALINSYWTMALQQLLGEGELATRLPYWVYWMGSLLIGFRMVRHFGPVSWATAIVLSLSVLLITLWNTFYVGYNPYMADLANPGVPDALFTLCLLLSFDALLQKDLTAWVLASILGSLVLYAGPVMFVLTTLAVLIWQPLERSHMLRAAIVGSSAMAAIAALYVGWGWKDGLLSGWWATLHGEYVVDFFAPYSRLQSNVIFVGYFVLGCGGLPALAVLRALRRSAWERTVASVVLGYLAIILCSATKNLHYLVPLLTPVVLLWSIAQASHQPARHWPRSWLAVASIVGCLLLCWPRSRPVFTLNRDVGELTTFQTDSYPQACRWSDVILLYDLEVTSWPTGTHVWVAYSRLEDELTQRRPILVTMDDAPSGYQRRAQSSTTGLKLYLDQTHTDWLQWTTSRQPETGQQRFPLVFQPIAVRPRPRLEL